MSLCPMQQRRSPQTVRTLHTIDPTIQVLQQEKQQLTPAGPKIPPFQSDKKVSPESTNPKLIDISPTPFSLFSSSSNSLKFRGTVTTSPAEVL